MIVFGTLANAQIVSDKTSEVHLDLSNTGTKTTIPEISWIHPSLEYTNSQEHKVEISARVESLVPLKSISVALKGTKDGESKGTKIYQLDAGTLQFDVSQSIRLVDGSNVIEIIAENETGGIVSSYRNILVGLDAIADAVAIDRKDYAILFATDKYEDWDDLVNPVFDSHAIAQELENIYGYEVEIVENATNEDVILKLRDYAQKNYKPQDQLMIFFAGHGQYDEVAGEGFVVASNSILNDPAKTSYISHNRLRNNINNIPCDHIFLVMDVCFGGTFDAELAGSRGVYEDTDQREYLVKKLSMKTRKFLTSGSKEYVSDGVIGQHSPFALRFIEALKSRGGEDNILILDEIRLYMERLKTTPRFDSFGSDETGSDFVFVVK
jgi:hypothetical protein